MENREPKTWHGGRAQDYMRVGFYIALGAVLLIALAVLVRHFLEAAVAVITPFLVGTGMALLLDPLVCRLSRGRMSRPLAAALVFGVFLLAMIGIAYAAIPALIDQATSFSRTAPDYLNGIGQSVNDYLAKHKHHIGPIPVKGTYDTILKQVTDRIETALQASAGSVVGFLLGSATMVVQLVVAIIVGFYILSDLDRLRARAYFLVPRRHRKLAGHLASDIGGVFSDYFRGLLIVCALYGLATILLLYGLSLWHKEIGGYALLVGASAGVLYAVPYIGALTIALVTFLVAFAAGQLHFAIAAVLLTLVLNQIFDNIVTPKVVGGGVGLHPVLALFALAIGGELFQLWGLLLSVPVAASVQVILYRVFPKLCEPTPREFLLAEGADPRGEGPKTGGGQADRPSDMVSPAADLDG